MKKCSFLVLLLAFFGILPVHSQSRTDCTQILQRKLKSDEPAVVLQKLNLLSGCGLDSIDVALLTRPEVLGNFIVNNAAAYDTLTYGHLVNLFEPFMKFPEYIEMKSNMRAAYAILNTTASLTNWEVDTKPFLATGMDKSQLEKAYVILGEKKFDKPTYRELFFEQTSIDKAIENKSMRRAEDSLELHISNLKRQFSQLEDASQLQFKKNINLIVFTNYKAGIRYAKIVSKPVLLYFNGLNCVNSRMIEKKILRTTEIHDILESDFVTIDLQCDCKTPLETNEQYFSKVLNRKTETVGDNNIDIESGTYGSEIQPFFVVLNTQGKQAATFQFSNDVKEFKEFLKKVR